MKRRERHKARKCNISIVHFADDSTGRGWDRHKKLYSSYQQQGDAVAMLFIAVRAYGSEADMHTLVSSLSIRRQSLFLHLNACAMHTFERRSRSTHTGLPIGDDVIRHPSCSHIICRSCGVCFFHDRFLGQQNFKSPQVINGLNG